MARSNSKIKVSTIKLLKHLEDRKKKLLSNYESDLKKYDSYIEKQCIKIASETRKAAEEIEEFDVSKINREYRGQISIKLKTPLKEKPNHPDFTVINNHIDFIKLSSSNELSLSQDEYNYLFR